MTRTAWLGLSLALTPLISQQVDGCQPATIRDADIQFNVGVMVASDGTLLTAGLITVDATNPAVALSGDCTDVIHETFQPVPGAPPMLQVEAGYTHLVALDESGGVWAWGYENDSGQLGTTTVSSSCTLLRIEQLADIVSIKAGEDHTLALDASGQVYAWGTNSVGQLGTLTGGNSAAVLKVPIPTRVTQIGAGAVHNLALDEMGVVWSWGSNNLGASGLSSTVSAPTALSLPPIQTIEVGGYHNIVISTNGDVYGWGSNYEGQLGNGTMGNVVTAPARQAQLDMFKVFAAGYSHTLALDEAGVMYAWGDNGEGQLGIGVKGVGVPSPKMVSTSQTDSALFGGWWASMSADAEGSLWGWGRNTVGGLGTGNTVNPLTPVLVSF